MEKYIIPGYVNINITNNNIILTNMLSKRKIEIDSEHMDEVIDIYNNGRTKIKSEVDKFLMKYDFLNTHDFLITEMKKNFDSLSNILNITIMVTEKCNFRCVYCYENHDKEKMNFKILDNILDFIESKLQTSKFKSLNISWFGGEPTLESNQILEYQNRINTIAAYYNVSSTANMTTNGYLLNKELFLKYIALGIHSYQITLDGREHDKLRFLSNRKPTLEHILSNLLSIKESNVDNYEIVIRRNIHADDNDLEWYNLLKDYFSNDSHFIFAVRPISQLGEDEVKLNLISKERVNQTLNKHYEYLENIGCTTLRKQDKINLYCYAGLPNGFVFRSNGEICKCTVSLDSNYNNIGNSINGKISIDEKQNSKWNHKILYDKCIECTSLLSCPYLICPNSRFKVADCNEFIREKYEDC